MKRWLAFGMLCLALCAPVLGRAETPYVIHWLMANERAGDVDEANGCLWEDARLGGGTYFAVNESPLSNTGEVPGAYAKNTEGSATNVAETEFSSVLLRWGQNDLSFHIRAKTDNTCVEASEIVHLISAPLGLKKLLWNVHRQGTGFVADTQRVNLTLEEINPPLARDIANLEAELMAEREWLYQHASQTVALTEKLDLLQQLDTELHDLVTRPLDEIAETDLDAIFDRYSEVVDDATRAALKQLLDDLKKSVIELEEELFRLIDDFGAQADAVANLATADAEDAGFNPDDPSEYTLSPADTPWIEVPDVSGAQGAFEEGNDPYAAYADAVLATLGDFVQGGNVVARGSFAANVRAWRANQAALEKALKERMSVSQAETNAFLNAQVKVTTYVQHFMDASYWYLNSPVPAHLRANVDGVLKNHFGPLAEEMKDNLNQWEEPTLDLGATQLVETISAFAGAVSSIGEVTTPYFEMMGTLVHATSRVAIGFVPVVGPTMDLCEAVTGKSFCLPDGKDLSTEERVFSGVGFGLGAVLHAWTGVKNAPIKPAGKAVAAKVLSLSEEFAEALSASRRTSYKTLRGAVGALGDPFEAKVGLHLLKNEGRALIGVGDDGVRRVLGIPKPSSQTAEGIAMAPDFLSVTKGNKLALSEVKAGKNTGTGHAIEQLQNAMKKLKELNLVGDVERVELVVPKGHTVDGDFAILNGFLVRPSQGNTRVKVDGFKSFIQVIQL